MELRRKQEGRCPVINETPHVFWASGRQAARRRCCCCCLGPAAPGRCRNCSAPALPPGRLLLLSGSGGAGGASPWLQSPPSLLQSTGRGVTTAGSLQPGCCEALWMASCTVAVSCPRAEGDPGAEAVPQGTARNQRRSRRSPQAHPGDVGGSRTGVVLRRCPRAPAPSRF